MSFMNEAANPRHPSPSIAATVTRVVREASRIVRRVALALDRQRRINDAVKVLSGLDDHVLQDMGVARGGIAAAARDIVAQQDRLEGRY